MELVPVAPVDPVDWLSRWVDALRPLDRADTAAVVARAEQLVETLESHPAAALAFADLLSQLLCLRMHRLAYAHTSSIGNHGFLGAIAKRLAGHLLPRNVSDRFLSDLLEQVFDHPTDHEWLAQIPLPLWERLLLSLNIDGPRFVALRQHCRSEIYQALRLLSTRAAALGTDPVLIRYLPDLAVHESPFLAQSDEVMRLNPDTLHPDNPPLAARRHFEVLLLQCDQCVTRIRKLSRQAGVDVGLVFQLARVDECLGRLRVLIALLIASPFDKGDEHPRLIHFAQQLVRQENRRNSVSDLVKSTFDLVARRITEHASRSGEHYITETRSGLLAMYRAAAGAGFIIAFMALIKLFLVKLALPPLWEAVAFSLNYGLGFVLIHALHLTIATKQPAMTAATLAASIGGYANRAERINALVDVAAKVVRTQWVSIAGNVSVGFMTACSLTLVAGRFWGLHPMTTSKASHLIEDLNPIFSPALIYAAIAGVFLYLSGLVSGYYDNLSLYRRVPERVNRSRWLRRMLGAERLNQFSQYVEHHLGALVGHFLFGCMLGSTPLVGKLIGLPLDIRHVAFASANLGYGLATLNFDVSGRVLLESILGVFLIGLVNLYVSFRLALGTALRSRGIGPDQTDGLTGATLRRFWSRPLDFFWPR